MRPAMPNDPPNNTTTQAKWTVLFNMQWPARGGQLRIDRARAHFSDEKEAQEFYDWCEYRSLVPTKRPSFEFDYN